MEDKRRVVILVVVAIVLAIAAIVLNIMDDYRDARDIAVSGQAYDRGGEIGIDIAPAPVEDKMMGDLGDGAR